MQKAPSKKYWVLPIKFILLYSNSVKLGQTNQMKMVDEEAEKTALQRAKKQALVILFGHHFALFFAGYPLGNH